MLKLNLTETCIVYLLILLLQYTVVNIKIMNHSLLYLQTSLFRRPTSFIKVLCFGWLTSIISIGSLETFCVRGRRNDELDRKTGRKIYHILAGPSRAKAGPGKTLSRGPITPPHSVCLEIETPKASRRRKRGERCSLTIRLGLRGSVVSSPSGVRGWILCIF